MTVVRQPMMRGPRGPAGSGSQVTDHGSLTGLNDDDHPQYATRQYVDDAIAAAIAEALATYQSILDS